MRPLLPCQSGNPFVLTLTFCSFQPKCIEHLLRAKDCVEHWVYKDNEELRAYRERKIDFCDSVEIESGKMFNICV